MEFKGVILEAYNFGDGRVVLRLCKALCFNDTVHFAFVQTLQGLPNLVRSGRPNKTPQLCHRPRCFCTKIHNFAL